MIDQIHPIFNKDIPGRISDLISKGSWLTEHTKTIEFETRICELLNVQYCSATTNGTMALILALSALGIKARDRVAVPALTMIATANAVKFLGAEPVFCDVDKNGCLDLKGIPDAVIYVSLNGRSSGLQKTLDLCRELSMPLIEDACQSFMSKCGEDYLGTIGDVGCFSLSPHKLISTGQGGLVVTNNEAIYKKIEGLKDFGRLTAGGDTNQFFGINAKYTDLQAVVGLSQLEDIHLRVSRKREIYKTYKGNLGCVDFLDDPDVPWFTDIYAQDRNSLMEYLKKREIMTRAMYKPLVDGFSNAEQLSKRGLYLPSSLNLSQEDIGYISKEIRNYYE